MLFLWVALYGLTDIIAVQLCSASDQAIWIRPLAMLLFTAFFVMWIIQNKDHTRIGLCPALPSHFSFFFDYFILLLLPISNYITGSRQPVSCDDLVLAASIALNEELFFRGYLFVSLKKKDPIHGIIMTSLIFALFHGVNFYQHDNTAYTIMQIVSAFFASICYCCTAHRHKSLLLCSIAHFLTNLTASGTLDNTFSWFGLSLSILTYLLYGSLCCYRIKTQCKEMY